MGNMRKWKVVPNLDKSPIRFVAYIESYSTDEALKIFESHFNISADAYQRMKPDENYAL